MEQTAAFINAVGYGALVVMGAILVGLIATYFIEVLGKWRK